MADVSPPEQPPAPPSSAHVPKTEEPPAGETRQEAERAGVDLDAMYRPPTTYELLARELPSTSLYDSNADGLEAEFAGGTVEISAEAMACSLAASDAPDRVTPPAPNETAESEDDSTDAQAVPSPNRSDPDPDLGERVL